MRWKYVLQTDASLSNIYRAAAPDTWMSFYLPRLFKGLVRVDESWPDVGSSIVLRYGLGPLAINIKQTVTEHQPGRHIRLHEEVLHGLWIDDNDIRFNSQPDGHKIITFISDQTSTFLPLRWLGPLRWCLNWLDLPPALQRLKEIIEADPPVG